MLLTTCANQERFVWKVTSLYPCRINQEKQQNMNNNTSHMLSVTVTKKGLVRELNPGPLAPKVRIIPLDQQAIHSKPNVNLPSQYIAIQTQ